MRVGVFGGSFNPPHVGHAMVAAWLGWTRRVDEVWLVPAFHHAFDKALAPWPVRVRAVEALAATVGPWCRAVLVEAELPRPSYTVNTLRVLAARHPGVDLHLVVGADVAAQSATWKEWETISTEFAPIVVGRAGHPPVAGTPVFPEVSSTEVRRRLAAGEPVDALVPAAVLDALAGVWPGTWRPTPAAPTP